MPIEIKELVIRATVESEAQGGGGAGKKSERKDEMVARCVEQVLEILRREKER